MPQFSEPYDNSDAGVPVEFCGLFNALPDDQRAELWRGLVSGSPETIYRLFYLTARLISSLKEENARLKNAA